MVTNVPSLPKSPTEPIEGALPVVGDLVGIPNASLAFCSDLYLSSSEFVKTMYSLLLLNKPPVEMASPEWTTALLLGFIVYRISDCDESIEELPEDAGCNLGLAESRSRLLRDPNMDLGRCAGFLVRTRGRGAMLFVLLDDTTVVYSWYPLALLLKKADFGLGLTAGSLDDHSVVGSLEDHGEAGSVSGSMVGRLKKPKLFRLAEPPSRVADDILTLDHEL